MFRLSTCLAYGGSSTHQHKTATQVWSEKTVLKTSLSDWQKKFERQNVLRPVPHRQLRIVMEAYLNNKF